MTSGRSLKEFWAFTNNCFFERNDFLPRSFAASNVAPSSLSASLSIWCRWRRIPWLRLRARRLRCQSLASRIVKMVGGPRRTISRPRPEAPCLPPRLEVTLIYDLEIFVGFDHAHWFERHNSLEEHFGPLSLRAPVLSGRALPNDLKCSSYLLAYYFNISIYWIMSWLEEEGVGFPRR